MKHIFHSGVSPVPNKEVTLRRTTVPLDPQPHRVALPLEGASPLVRPGDRVLMGQPIAQGGGPIPWVHASVSGRVAAIQDHPHPLGGLRPAILLDNDGQNSPWPRRPAPLTGESIPLDQLVHRVDECGIVGMGGGSYPTAEKLRQAAGKIDTLILNAAECEPWVTADHRLLAEAGQAVLRGGRTLARTLGAKVVILAVQRDKLGGRGSLDLDMGRGQDKVDLCPLPARYPIGAENPLVRTVTGREIPPGGSPVDVKCLVLNVATVFAVQEALEKGLPLTHRTITVTGGAVSRPRNLWVPLGTPMKALLEGVGGLKEQPRQMVTGGPLMGKPLQDLEAPVTKGVNALVCLSQADYEEYRRETGETVCIHCGKCVAVCPMRLSPVLIRRAVRRGIFRRLPGLHPQDCIQCGSCAYACPARIPLPQIVQQGAVLNQKGGVLK